MNAILYKAVFFIIQKYKDKLNTSEIINELIAKWKLVHIDYLKIFIEIFNLST